ncbi:MAG: right-handed parallel beta-helix repeat-containing protein [Bacteroidota bacterium]
MRFKIFTILNVISFYLLATDYYVAKTGSDANPGTEALPFLTIGRAASVMVAGDNCYIKTGVYREVLSPVGSGSPGSPIRFISYNQDVVVISSTEEVTGWTVHSGNIYKAQVNMPLGDVDNMLYAEGFAMDIARWPNNTDNDPFTIDAEPVSSGTASSISRFSIPNFDWSGGYVYYLGAHSGTSWTRPISSSSSGRINFAPVDVTKWPFNPHNPTVFRNNNYGRFYLFGILEALDHPGEWYYDRAAGTLYFNAPNNLNPAELSTEYTARAKAIDISTNYIEIDGLQTMGGRVSVEGDFCTVRNCRIRYGAQRLDDLNNTNAQLNDGSLLIYGSNNLVQNNLIEFSATNGISLGQAWRGHRNNLIDNNVIRYCNTIGNHSSPIRSNQQNATITNNTAYAAGRDGFYINGENSETAYNDIYDCMKINNDGGIFYVVGNQFDKNSVIHHNWFHDSEGPDYADGRVAGIYLDNNSKGYLVHHNVVWNITWTGIQLNWDNWNIDIFNNTIYEAHDGAMGRWENGYTLDDVVLKNNYANKPSDQEPYVIDGWVGTDVSASNLIDQNDYFVSVSEKDFTPEIGSPLVNGGEDIAGITDGSIGSAPDIGAYEAGIAPWVPGVDWEIPDLVLPKDAFPNYNLRIAYDLSEVSNINGAVYINGDVTDGLDLEMSPVGNGIYEYTFQSLESTLGAFSVKYENGTSMEVEHISEDCEIGSSENERLPLIEVEDEKTYRFKFGGCQISTFEAGGWDVEPSDYFEVRVKDDALLPKDLIVSDLMVYAGHSLTVNNNATLEINGSSKSTEPTSDLIDLDFEYFTIVSFADLVYDAGTVSSYEISSEEAYHGANSLKIVGSGGSDNFLFASIEVSADDLGEYEFSFYAKTDGNANTRLSRWRFQNWAGNQLQIVTPLTNDWTHYSMTETITQPGIWLLHFQPSSSGATYYDDILVRKTGEAPVEGKIIVRSGSSLITYESNGNMLEATIHRNKRFAEARYSFVGTPVGTPDMTGSDLGDFVYSFNEQIPFGTNDGLDRWQDASTSEISVGKGYAAAGGDSEFVFTGIPNDGDVVVDGLTITSGLESGWNLVSNPYPAALNVEKVVSGLGSAIYLWDDGGSEVGRRSNSDYMVVSLLGQAGAGPNSGVFNGYIGAAQGFFIKLTGSPTTNASITFTESMRVGGNNEDEHFFRKPNARVSGKVRLSLENKGNAAKSEILIGMAKDATFGFDPFYDAALHSGGRQTILYSIFGDQKYTINGLPEADQHAIPLGMKLDVAGDYILSVAQVDLPSPGLQYYLLDREEDHLVPLIEDLSYDFSAKAGENQSRFELVLDKQGLLLSELETALTFDFSVKHSDLNVEFSHPLDIYSYQLIDLSGKVLFESDQEHNRIDHLRVPLVEDHLHILRLSTSEGSIIQKLVLR